MRLLCISFLKKSNDGIKLYKPLYEDLWFRKQFLSDEETMSYNHAWGGTIDFSEEKWPDWYKKWVCCKDNSRFYRYLINNDKEFVGEAAYYRDDLSQRYIANIIVYSKYRRLGYGRAGLQLLCGAAKEKGLAYLYDNIAIDNTSVSLFWQCGFEEVSRTEEIITVFKRL